MPAQEPATQDEISIRDIGVALWTYKRFLVGLPFLFALVAAVGVALVEPQWEAVSVIQVGQIWQVAMPLESPNRTVERMKLRPFKAAVLADLGIPATDAHPLARLYNNSLKVKLIANTDLVEFRVRARSRAEAERWANATVKHLQRVHERLAEPLIARLRQQQAQIKRQTQLVQEEKARLLKAAEIKSEISPGTRFAESIVLSNFLLQKDAELRAFELQALTLGEQLDPAKTYPTSLLDKIHVPEKRAYPKRAITVFLAAVLGLFFAVVLSLLLSSVRANRPT